MANSEFRNLFQDANLVLHQVLSDTMRTASEVTGAAADELAPTKEPGKLTDLHDADRVEDSLGEPSEVAGTVAEGAKETARTFIDSARENVVDSETTKSLVKERMRKAITQLKETTMDYDKSVSMFTEVLKTYIKTYASTLEETVDTNIGVDVDPSLKRAADHLWSFVQQFGDKNEWQATKEAWDSLLRKMYKGTPKQESLTAHVSKETENWLDSLVNMLQKLLTDPNYLLSDEQKSEFNEKVEEVTSTGEFSSVREDVYDLMDHTFKLVSSVFNDKAIIGISETISQISSQVIAPEKSDSLWINPNIKNDFLQVILPSLFTLIYFIPIPRLELTTDDAAVLLSTLVLEPGMPPTSPSFSSNPATTPSFFPERLRLETYSDIDIARRSPRPLPPTKLTLTLETLSMRADDFGYRLLIKPNRNYDARMYHRPSRGWFETQGLASFAIDKRGMDVSVTVDVSTNSLENLVSLNNTKVKIHNISWQLHPTPFKKIRPRNKAINALLWPISFIWKLIKYIILLPILYVIIKPLILTPLLKLFLRKALERSIAEGIHAANTELVFARERLRAVKVAKPESWIAWWRALSARWQQGESNVEVGMSGTGVWSGIRGVGGLDAIWEEEGIAARDRVVEEREGGWKNNIFDLVK